MMNISTNISSPGCTRLKALLVMTCEERADAIEAIMDENCVLTWTHLPACQSRRLGFLQNVARTHPDQCCLFLGFGEAEAVELAFQSIGEARDAGEICPDCAVFTWDVNAPLHSDPHMDLVCDQVVDATHAVTLERDGEMLHFCSTACRDAFEDSPEIYLERRDARCRVGRRDVLTVH